MKFLSARRTLSAGIIAATSVAAFALPSAASAALPGHCLGSNIEGRGATFPEAAQNVWKVAFNEAGFAKKGGCASVKVAYNTTGPIGSGAGYKEWFEKEHYGSVAFIGTDNTVNQKEKEGIENEAEGGKPAKENLMTVPIVEGAIAMVVHLPTNCKAAATNTAPGRIALTRAMIKKIYTEGATWKEVEEEPSTKNALENDGGTCETSAKITPVVRFDGSGTTHIFKESIQVTDETAKVADESGEEHTWAELAEGTKTKSEAICGTAKDNKLNECWPTAAKVVHAKHEGNPGLLEEVANTPGSIGYADLSQARSKDGFAPGGVESTPQKFWAVVQNSEKKGKPSYADPSSNGYMSLAAESNCKKTTFQNPGGATPPSVFEAWNRVSAKLESKSYALCGATYMLVLTNYELYKSHEGASGNEAQSVKDYLAFITSKKGGAKVISTKDYFPLASNLASKVTEALSHIED